MTLYVSLDIELAYREILDSSAPDLGGHSELSPCSGQEGKNRPRPVRLSDAGNPQCSPRPRRMPAPALWLLQRKFRGHDSYLLTGVGHGCGLIHRSRLTARDDIGPHPRLGSRPPRKADPQVLKGSGGGRAIGPGNRGIRSRSASRSPRASHAHLWDNPAGPSRLESPRRR